MIKYFRNQDTIAGRLHDEMVMMDLSLGKYFSLNPTATTIWELLEKPLTLEEICHFLTGEYEVEPGQCHREVEEHLSDMVQRGLIHTLNDRD